MKLNNNFTILNKALSEITPEIKEGQAMYYDAAEYVLNLINKCKNEDILKTVQNNAKKFESSTKQPFYNIKNIFLREMNGFEAQSTQNTLKSYKALNLKSLPEFIESKELSPDKYLLITRANFPDVIPFERAYSQISESVKKDFYAEMMKLNKIGVTNEAIFKAPETVFVSSDFKQILISDWSKTRLISGEEASSNLNAIRKFIFKD